MKKISLYLALSLMIVAGVMGIGIGYYLTPQYSLAMYDKNTMDLGRADKWLDLRYINAMIAHHRGALLVARQAEQSTRDEVRNLARDIQQNEPPLIDELYAWKKEWYGDARRVADPVVPQLGPVDDTFDLRFLNVVIAHHEAGIAMTQDVRLKSSNAQVLNNADAVESFLRGSMSLLTQWRKDWYNL